MVDQEIYEEPRMAGVDKRVTRLEGREVLVPICVPADGLTSATRFYEQVVAAGAALDLELGGDVHARRIGQILLVTGPERVLEEVRRLQGIVIVDDLAAAIDAARSSGGVVIKDTVPVGDGQLSHVRHPDGAIFEYLAL